MELQGWTRDRADNEVVDTVRRNLIQIFESAASEGIATEAAARKLADSRLFDAISR